MQVRIEYQVCGVWGLSGADGNFSSIEEAIEKLNQCLKENKTVDRTCRYRLVITEDTRYLPVLFEAKTTYTAKVSNG